MTTSALNDLLSPDELAAVRGDNEKFQDILRLPEKNIAEPEVVEDDDDSSDADNNDVIDDEPPVDDKGIKIPKHRFDAVSKKNKDLEAQLAIKDAEAQRLQQFIDASLRAMNQAPLTDVNEEKFEPLDPEADKAYRTEIAKIQAENARRDFQTALRFEEQLGKTKYADFDKAYEAFVANQVNDVMKRANALGINLAPQQAQQEALNIASNIMHVRHQQGLPIADFIYQESGLAAKKQQETGKGINHEAIARNREKSERPNVEKIPAVLDGIHNIADASPDELIRSLGKISKKGVGVDNEQFNDIIRTIRKQ